jgi:H+/Cl- antiporter ClcA
MKSAYGIAGLLLLLGLWLLSIGVADREQGTLLSMTLHSRVSKGVGIISLLLGLIAVLAAYGSSLPARSGGRRPSARVQKGASRHESA